VLDPTQRMLFCDGRPVGLTPKAFDILAVLAGSGGKLVGKDTILRTVWPDTIVDEGNLTFQVSTLRKALGKNADCIVTVPGRGYQLAAGVVMEERVTTTVVVSADRRPLYAIAAAIALLAVIAIWHRGGAPASSIHSLAVLPFKPLIPNQRDEALELGMTDTLITKIGSIRGLTVRPLSAVRRYGGLEQDAIDAGRRLGVDAVVDGSIRREANNIHVNVRLLRVSDSAQLWSTQFDSPFTRIFSIQDSIVTNLADGLSLKLSGAEWQVLRKQDTRNPDAYRAYLLGRYQYNALRRDSLLKSIESYKTAIALDPVYAAAYAGLADSYCVLPISSDFLSGPSSQLAIAAANKAIGLDPLRSDAHNALGSVKFWYAWDWKGSEEEFRRGIAINPSNPSLHLRYAHLLSNTGRHAEGRRKVEEALRLDPLWLPANTLAGIFLLNAGELDASIAQSKRALEINPDYWVARDHLGKAYEQKGMFEEALEQYRQSYAHSAGSTEPLARRAHLLARMGRKSEARKILAEMMAISKQRYVPPYNIALMHVGLGDKDQALRWMGRACAEHDARMVFLKVEPLWGALRPDPRFSEIERCVGM
jgi:DNA-binding winged helix-turn-helix (wHTH) protein/TolB-like protein/tetratricopeptide (TPR) repeat protein